MAAADLEVELDGILRDGDWFDLDEVAELLAGSNDTTAGAIEESFGAAGWYDGTAAAYPPPTVPFDAPPSANPPTIEAERRLWLARYNPAAANFVWSDIDNDTYFPWTHPEAAPQHGWWLNTIHTPAGRAAIFEITTGDLVICQRTDPKQNRRPGDTYNQNMLVGICVVGMTDSWDDIDTERRERRVCLVPLTKFNYPVPRRTARNNFRRLIGDSFSEGQQLPGRQGPIGFGLSYVEWDDAVELLSVCGISPEVLAEPDTALLAARLRASETGNKAFLRYRYDAVLRDRVRRVHERQAEQRAEVWAESCGYVKRACFQHVPLAGFDLLFADADGKFLQVEVKGYGSHNLATVHLQPSQAWRAKDAAGGCPPDWRLFALLGAGSKIPSEQVFEPFHVLELLAASGLQVKGGWPAPRPVRH